MPKSPERIEPTTWEHYDLFSRVKEAIWAIPDYFESETNIEGMLASDIFTLNSALGATIEERVVITLNNMRPIWDPEKKYQAYSFTRQPQVFPDVLLRKKGEVREIILGIELKGWYVLAKEGMPNFRFVASPKACNPWDLIVVVPWVLSNILSGSPITFHPFIELAKYAAEKRNYYWEYERDATGDKRIECAEGITPYPQKSDKISDKAKSDGGGNFGRLARYGLMNDYVEELMEANLKGIKAKEWLAFLKRNARDVEY